jgi:hypothetical protein
MRFLITLALLGSLYGQRILYNQDLDKQGQQAAAASKKIASDPLTSQELQNLKTIEKQQIDGTLKAGYVAMRTSIQAFDKWTSVSRNVCAILRQLYAADEIHALLIAASTADASFDGTCTPAALQQEAAEASRRKGAVRQEEARVRQVKARERNPQMPGTAVVSVRQSIDSLAKEIQQHVADAKQLTAAKTDEEIAAKVQQRARGAAKSKGGVADSTHKSPDATVVEVTASAKSALDAALDRLGNVDDLLSAAKDAGLGSDKAEAALTKIEDGLKQVDALIGSVHAIWAAYADIQVDPRSLIPSKEKLAASLLALDADRIKELAAIRAANVLYLEDLQKRLEDCLSILSRMQLWYSTEAVETTLTSTNDSARIYNVIYCLHLTAAGAAVNQTPSAIEAVRESIAQRRFSLRRDGIYNGAYEQALRASAERLAAYYASGITKSQVAQLLYYLSGMVSLPKLAF